MEQNNNELVLYNERGELVECNFQRVDFNNPPSILSYGDEVKEAITNILNSTAQIAVSSEEYKINDSLISSIASFDDSLDNSEKENKKNSIVKGIKGFLGQLGIERMKEEAEKDTYKGRFKEYCSQIEKVCTVMASQSEASMRDIDTRSAIISEMKPQIEQLELIIKAGKLDKEKFDASILELKKTASPDDQALQYEIQYKEKLSEVFNNKLSALEKVLVLYKEQIHSYRIQQTTDMQLVMNIKSYLSDSAPILKAQGSVMVFSRLQENRIKTLENVNQATNRAIINNAKCLEQNVAKAVDLSLNNGVSIDTLKYLCKGGRCSKGVYLMGSLLKIKPILQIHGEKLDTFKKTRTIENAKRIMIDQAKTDIANFLSFDGKTDNIHIDVAYTKDDTDAQKFAQEIATEFGKNDIIVNPLSLSVSCHIGPGALAIAATKDTLED